MALTDKLTAIADAIRAKTGESGGMTLGEMPGKIAAISGGSLPESYDGAYEITPSQETQTLQTAGKCMTDDLVVKSIPQNYGLITYNGHELTIS